MRVNGERETRGTNEGEWRVGNARYIQMRVKGG